MTDLADLERQANNHARSLMGEVAWPTVVLAVVVAMAYVATVCELLAGSIGLFTAYISASLSTYAIYTVMHDATHGSIQGKNKSLSWLNNGLGYLAGQILFIPFRIHQQEHLAHHRHTNGEEDPDMFVADDSLKSLFSGTMRVVFVQYQYYFSKKWQSESTSNKMVVVTEVALMIAWRTAIVVAGYWQEAIVLFVFSGVTGIFILVVLFVWLVHRPNVETQRYLNTNTILLPNKINHVVTWLWLFQNYHSVHHLFPRVPFYHYKRLFEKIQQTMQANHAPILRVGQHSVSLN